MLLYYVYVLCIIMLYVFIMYYYIMYIIILCILLYYIYLYKCKFIFIIYLVIILLRSLLSLDFKCVQFLKYIDYMCFLIKNIMCIDYIKSIKCVGILLGLYKTYF